MKQHLYKYHNLPLYFWLNPRDVEGYNKFNSDKRSTGEFPNFSDYVSAMNVLTKTSHAVEKAYERGLVPANMKSFTSYPLTRVY